MLRKILGKKEQAVSTTGETIQKLRDMEELLARKQEHLEAKIVQEVSSAKKHGLKNKRAALKALKRKKRFEAELKQTDGTLTTIEMQREALESVKTNTDVLSTLTQASKALKSAQQNMDADKVHDILDEIAEQHDVAREISAAISNPIGFSHDVDEAELERELEELEQEDLDSALLHIPDSSTKPDEFSNKVVPLAPAQLDYGLAIQKKAPEASSSAKTPKKAEDSDDEDLKQLSSWADT